MEVLVLDGKDYVKASKAARDLGYATDYVGQLCRSGQIDAHLIGRTWYVNKDELSNHKVEKKRISRVKAREYAKRSIEEHKKNIQEKEKTNKDIEIQYESDNEELIPEVRKLTIASDVKKSKRADYGNLEKSDELRVEHKGEKVLMEGSVKVVDVTDGIVDEHTTLLTPRINRRKNPPEPSEDTSDEIEAVEEKPNFLTRLAESGVATTTTPVTTVDTVEEEEVVVEEVLDTHFEVHTAKPHQDETETGGLFWYACTLLVLLAFTVCSLFFTRQMTYDLVKRPQINERIQFSFNTTIEIIKLKI